MEWADYGRKWVSRICKISISIRIRNAQWQCEICVWFQWKEVLSPSLESGENMARTGTSVYLKRQFQFIVRPVKANDLYGCHQDYQEAPLRHEESAHQVGVMSVRQLSCETHVRIEHFKPQWLVVALLRGAQVHSGYLQILSLVHGEQPTDIEAMGGSRSPVEALTPGDRLLYCNVLPILPVALLALLFQVTVFRVFSFRNHSLVRVSRNRSYTTSVQAPTSIPGSAEHASNYSKVPEPCLASG